nr:hypothetical protein [uncultured Blautia sp.]
MKAVKKIEISVLHKRTMPLVVYTMQGDTGREIECAVVDWDIPAGVVARAWVVKPSKKVVYSEARIVENSVVFSLTNQMLAEPGVAICIIEFDSGEDVVSSFPFNLCIDGSARGDGIPSENESTVLEGMFEALGQDAIKALDAAKAEAVAANKSAQDTEKIKNDFTLTAQQAVADVNNAGQTQTQRVNTAGDTQVSRIQAEGTTQVQNVQATAAEISADREQIHTNRDNTARLQRTTAGAITRSAEGSFITLEDAADEMGFRRLEFDGKTVQDGTPSPEIEIPLENVGVQNTDGKYAVKVAACGKNIADFKPSSETTHYSGALCADAYLTPNTTYCISGFATVGNAYYANEKLFLRDAIVSEDNNGRFMIIATTLSDISINDPAQYIPGYGWRLLKNNKDNAAHNFSGLQMETGGTATEFAPHRGHTATITSDRPLTKWDKLTCRDGVWGWRYKGRTKTYTGAQPERWMAYSNTAHKVARSYRMEAYNLISYASGDAALNADINIMCDRFVFGGYVGHKENVSIGYSENQYMYIRLDDDAYAEIDTVDKFRAWLAEYPITVQYPTEEEEWIPLSAEEQAAMNALCTYAGTTHIWTDDPLQPVISLDYTVDIEGYIRDTTPAYRDVERFALTGEASGTVATCTDSAEWPLLCIGMLGKCEQLSTTGANLFGGRALADKILLEVPSAEQDMINKTIKFSSSAISGKVLYSDFKPNQQYAIVLYGRNMSSDSKGTNLVLNYSDGTKSILMFLTNGSVSYCIAISDANKTIASLSGTWNSNFTVLYYDKCGIFEGAIDLASFEPYTGAAPSPSPAYKQDIQETGTYNPETGMYEADMVMTGAQILDFEQCLKTWKSQYTQEGRVYKITAIGTGYQAPISFSAEDTKVTLSGIIRDISGSGYRVDLMDSSGNIVGRINKDIKSVTGLASKIRLNFAEAGAGEYADIMLNAGDTALPWEPYQSDTLRLTADQPWRGIGDVHDEVCDRDGVLGTWRRFAEDILDGSEDEKWEITDCSDSAHKRFCSGLIRPKTKPAALNAGVEPLLCNAYKAISANDSYSKNQGISVEVTGKIPIYDNTFSPTADLSGFKAHLAEQPITVVYQLKEPYFVPFPEDIQRAYRKLKSYAGTTHAWVDDPLQPEVSFRYIKDSKLVLGKLEDRLTALEAGQAQTVAAFSYLPPETQAAMIENETRELIESI